MDAQWWRFCRALARWLLLLQLPCCSPRFELPGLGLSCLQPPTELTSFVHVAAAKAIGSQAIPSMGLQSDGLQPKPAVHLGLIISGDQFINSTQAVQALRTALPDALAVEMEGAAVARDYSLAVIREVLSSLPNQAT